MFPNLLDNLWYLLLVYERIFITSNIIVIWLAVSIQNSDGALTLPLAFFTLNRELSMRITLCIEGCFCDIDSLNVWYLVNNWSDVVDYNLSIFISLKKQKLSSLFVIVCVHGSYRNLLINLVVLQHGD